MWCCSVCYMIYGGVGSEMVLGMIFGKYTKWLGRESHYYVITHVCKVSRTIVYEWMYVCVH